MLESLTVRWVRSASVKSSIDRSRYYPTARAKIMGAAAANSGFRRATGPRRPPARQAAQAQARRTSGDLGFLAPSTSQETLLRLKIAGARGELLLDRLQHRRVGRLVLVRVVDERGDPGRDRERDAKRPPVAPDEGAKRGVRPRVEQPANGTRRSVGTSG